jgi:hypothetical protein
MFRNSRSKSETNMANNGIKKDNFLSLITVPLKSEMAIIGFTLKGNVVTFSVAANMINRVPMIRFDLL